MITGNVVRDGSRDGIFCGDACSIMDNVSYDNGDATGEDGIQCGTDCNVQRNTVSENFGLGLRLSTDSGYRGNVFSANLAGDVSGGTNLGDNLCSGGLCP